MNLFKKLLKSTETPQELYEKYGWKIVQCKVCKLIKNHAGTNPLGFMICPKCGEYNWEIIKK